MENRIKEQQQDLFADLHVNIEPGAMSHAEHGDADHAADHDADHHAAEHEAHAEAGHDEHAHGEGHEHGTMVDAGAGDDIILAQGGDDIVTGGAGADLFVYTLAAAEGRDAILDFSTDEGDLLSFIGVTDSDGSGAIDIDDVIAGFADGGGPGAVDSVTLESGSVLLITDMSGVLADLASLETHSLINGA